MHIILQKFRTTIWIHGKPKNIRCDNGTEFTSHKFTEWCSANEIDILFTQPGHPTQNSYVEQFNGSYRRAVLDAFIFKTINEAREVTEEWRTFYNNQRPHESLGNQTPMSFRNKKLFEYGYN